MAPNSGRPSFGGRRQVGRAAPARPVVPFGRVKPAGIRLVSLEAFGSLGAFESADPRIHHSSARQFEQTRLRCGRPAQFGERPLSSRRETAVGSAQLCEPSQSIRATTV